MKHKVPPPYTAVQGHGVFPKASHDEAARYDFLANFNNYLAVRLSAGNKRVYDKRVVPAFIREHGRPPETRTEVRLAMNKDPWHRFWSAMKRNSMEMRQHNGRQIALRQLDELDARARQFNEGRATLQLDPSVEIPRYQAVNDIHCMPGSYHGEERPGDISTGANYDSGFFATTAGMVGALSDGGGVAIAEWAKQQKPGWKPRRILDLGCTIGHNVVPIALAFPDAEVIAIDTAGASLRYAHARAQSLGAKNLTFIQMNAEDLSRFPEGHFDWVQTTMFLHELSTSALPKILKQAYRVLAPGGLMLHVEQPQYTEDMPLYEQFIRDWDAYNNNEPFWSVMHDLDIPKIMEDTGFPRESQFETGVVAIVDEKIFPKAEQGAAGEDHGRAPVWNAYGAWRPQ